MLADAIWWRQQDHNLAAGGPDARQPERTEHSQREHVAKRRCAAKPRTAAERQQQRDRRRAHHEQRPTVRERAEADAEQQRASIEAQAAQRDVVLKAGCALVANAQHRESTFLRSLQEHVPGERREEHDCSVQHVDEAEVGEQEPEQRPVLREFAQRGAQTSHRIADRVRSDCGWQRTSVPHECHARQREHEEHRGGPLELMRPLLHRQQSYEHQDRADVADADADAAPESGAMWRRHRSQQRVVEQKAEVVGDVGDEEAGEHRRFLIEHAEPRHGADAHEGCERQIETRARRAVDDRAADRHEQRGQRERSGLRQAEARQRAKPRFEEGREQECDRRGVHRVR